MFEVSKKQHTFICTYNTIYIDIRLPCEPKTKKKLVWKDKVKEEVFFSSYDCVVHTPATESYTFSLCHSCLQYSSDIIQS